MEIVYPISTILLFVGFILVEKTKNKVDILKQIVLTIVLLFCYNATICYILTFLNLKSTLESLSLINFIFASIEIIYIVKTKKIQKFSFNKMDLLYIVIIAIATIIVSYLNFGFPFEIKYETGDPATHYLTADLFREQDSLLPKGRPDQVFGSLSNRKTASYVNTGLIMKCLERIVDPIDNYNVFIIFGITILFLNGWMFYSTISRFAKNNKTRFLAFIVSILYLMGYPLNSFLFGFEYLSMGILVLNAIIASIDIYQKEEIGYKLNLLVFFLLNYGLFTAYYMFVPFVYSGLWIYFCINHYKKKKKIFSKKLIIQLIITLILPFILGYIYHISPEIFAVFMNKSLDINIAIEELSAIVNQGLASFGYIYVNLFSNTLPILTLAIITMYKQYKENRGTIIITYLAFLFIFILLIGYMFEKVSMYYLSKNYFALWLLLYYLAYKGLLILYEKKKIIPFALVTTYISAIIITLIFVDTNVPHGQVDRDENILQVADIYGANKTILENENDLNLQEIELLKVANEIIPKESKFEVAGNIEQGFWTYALIRRINNDDDEHFGIEKLEYKMLELWKRIGNIDYCLYFNRGKYYQKWKKELLENAEIIYENDAGGILKYNNLNK